jgi:hypothetical protein
MYQDGTDDQRKGTQLLEVYALEIQMYTEQKNNKKLKQLYEKYGSFLRIVTAGMLWICVSLSFGLVTASVMCIWQYHYSLSNSFGSAITSAW